MSDEYNITPAKLFRHMARDAARINNIIDYRCEIIDDDTRVNVIINHLLDLKIGKVCGYTTGSRKMRRQKIYKLLISMTKNMEPDTFDGKQYITLSCSNIPSNRDRCPICPFGYMCGCDYKICLNMRAETK